MFRVEYKEPARDDLRLLDNTVARRIIKKVTFYAAQENPLRFAKRLTDFERGAYRFRIGNYRATFDLVENDNVRTIVILRIKHRKEIYGKA